MNFAKRIFLLLLAGSTVSYGGELEILTLGTNAGVTFPGELANPTTK